MISYISILVSQFIHQFLLLLVHAFNNSTILPA